MKDNIFKPYLAEFIGTFFLVFNGTGAIIIDSLTGNTLGGIGIALVFGLTIMIMVYACGHISGAHFNPAVTIALFSFSKISVKKTLLYITTQITAAILASALLYFLFGNIKHMGATLPLMKFGNKSLLVSFIAEAIFTFCLLFIILCIVVDEGTIKHLSGIIIGLTIAMGALMIGPISGGSFNPARSLGPAIISGNMNHIWLYITAPVTGAVMAVIFFKAMRMKATVKKS